MATAFVPVVAALWGCAPDPTTTQNTLESTIANDFATGSTASAELVDVTAASGLDFTHDNGATGELYYPEMMQGGAALFDADDDGLLDVYLIQSGPLPPRPGDAAHENRFFRNLGNGQFEDHTGTSGLGDRHYGSGVATGDFDADGKVDVYVTNLGRNQLYRNRGDGTFENVTDQAKVGDDSYSTSATFFDADRDGDLDLFVANYVEWSVEGETTCLGYNGQRGYCSPLEYEPATDTFYENLGNGTFADRSARSGIATKKSNGLGVVAADLDGDGWLDLYVANDQMANQLWRNNQDGSFSDEALVRGVALNGRGAAEAGMGVVAADPDFDLDWDLFVVHLSTETNTFYENTGGDFRDVTNQLELAAVSQPYTGFGTGLVDFDHDGLLDLFVANGRVSHGDRVDDDFSEPNQLLRGAADGTYSTWPTTSGDLERPAVSRAAAFGDIDNDGDIDILVANNAAPPQLLRNDAARGHWLTVDLRGATNRSALGSIIEITYGAQGESVTRMGRSATDGSYCAANDSRAHFGLGETNRVARLEVRWSDGAVTELEQVAVDRILEIEHPSLTSESDRGGSP